MSKLDEIVEEGIVVIKNLHTGDTYRLKDSATQEIKALFMELIQKPSSLPKTQNSEAVKQGINFYYKQLLERMEAL